MKKLLQNNKDLIAPVIFSILLLAFYFDVDGYFSSKVKDSNTNETHIYEALYSEITALPSDQRNSLDWIWLGLYQQYKSGGETLRSHTDFYYKEALKTAKTKKDKERAYYALADFYNEFERADKVEDIIRKLVALDSQYGYTLRAIFLDRSNQELLAKESYKTAARKGSIAAFLSLMVKNLKNKDNYKAFYHSILFKARLAQSKSSKKYIVDLIIFDHEKTSQLDAWFNQLYIPRAEKIEATLTEQQKSQARAEAMAWMKKYFKVTLN